MGDMTTIGEILEFAIEREGEAVEFYMAMADRVKNPAVQELFEDLVTEELEHKSRLELEVMKEGIVARTVGVLLETSLDNTTVDLGARSVYCHSVSHNIAPELLPTAFSKLQCSQRQNATGSIIFPP